MSASYEINNWSLTAIIDRRAAVSLLISLSARSGMPCPGCEHQATQAQIERLRGGGRARCNACGQWYGWSSSTDYLGSKLQPEQLAALHILHAAGIAAEASAALIGCHISTVRNWFARMQKAKVGA